MLDYLQHPEARSLRVLRIVSLVALSGVLLSGCAGVQSALSPASQSNEQVITLFWIMVVGSAIIWLVVLGIAIAATLGTFGNPSRHSANALVIGGGVIFPTIVLAALLIYGLGMLPNWQDDPERLQIHVHGEQWWWRVSYVTPDGRGDLATVISANEIHMPAGQPVEFVLTSADVIHSFWIPAIGGKLDMIPGRTNRLLLEADKPGIYRGVCAEYCGTSHANMAFAAEVHAPEDFQAWLARRTTPVSQSLSDRGSVLFLSSGCGACHRVAGFSERGTVGPDLTHFGSRNTIAAGIMENTPDNLARWIADPESLKAGVQMPGYTMLPDTDIAAIAQFLTSLK